MKKIVLVLVLMAAFSIGSLLQAQVLINEVQYDATQVGTDSLFEWIELYNPTGDDIDLTGWRICDNNDPVGDLCPAVVIGAGEYLVFACSVDSFHVNFPSALATAWSTTCFGDGLANSSDMVVLADPTDIAADEVNWGTVSTSWPSWIKYGGFNPGAIDAAPGHSIGRSPNGYDTNVASDWADMAIPTPGATNGGAVVYTPHTIYDIQNGGNLTDSTVSVVGIVTSENYVDFNGFMLAEASGPWHGVVVYSTTAVSRGDSVAINGTVTEYNGLTELTASQVTVLGTGTIPAFTSVSLADVKTGSGTAESYEGVLVRIPKALACDTTWMSPTFGEWAACLGPDTLRIDNSSNPNGIYYAKPIFGVDSVMVTGVMTYSYSQFKLMPRDSADVVNYGPTGVTGQPLSAKSSFKLMPCLPNPAKNNTKFSFNLSQGGNVELSIFNVLGQKVATLYKGSLASGQHTVNWNLKDGQNRTLPNGIYFYQLTDNSHNATRRMLILK